MKYTITDLIEPDNGCEGFMPGEEPTVTLTLSDGRTVRVYDRLAYEKGWDVGAEISDEEISQYGKAD
ncbi:MAG: hypothetical protein IJ555_04355 [Ruminococcus sp.]|nr:hypothetical protein [Ruminococcus sp.]